MKLFIWEGNGISDAYHDDGTLVVLAETPEQAREVVRANKTHIKTMIDEYQAKRREIGFDNREALAILAKEYFASNGQSAWDGADEALDREPDRIIELNTQTVVAFNGGGYD